MAYRLWATSIIVGMALGILSACASSGSVQSPTAPMPSVILVQPAKEEPPVPVQTINVSETLAPEEPSDETMKPTPETPYIANLVQLAQQDLAKRLSISSESIEFLTFEDVVWPDGSLGCPRPGMAYTQVLVEGYRILLRYEGQVYAYHGGGSNPPTLCENPQN